jgi:hypothetical protein
MPILDEDLRSGIRGESGKETANRQIGGGSKIEATRLRKNMSKKTYKDSFRRTHYEVSRPTTQKGQSVGIDHCRSVKKCQYRFRSWKADSANPSSD